MRKLLNQIKCLKKKTNLLIFPKTSVSSLFSSYFYSYLRRGRSTNRHVLENKKPGRSRERSSTKARRNEEEKARRSSRRRNVLRLRRRGRLEAAKYFLVHQHVSALFHSVLLTLSRLIPPFSSYLNKKILERFDMNEKSAEARVVEKIMEDLQKNNASTGSTNFHK
jgi:hypothetical protein